MSGGRAHTAESEAGPRQIRCATTDPERARAVGRDLSPRLRLCSAGTDADFSISFEAVRLAPVTIGVLAVGGPVRLETDGLEAAYHVYLPLTGSVAVDHGRESVVANPDRAAVQRPTGAGVVHLPPGVRLLVVGLDRHALEQHLEALSGRPASPIRLAATLDVDRGAGLTWARTVRVLAAERPDGLLWRPPVVDVMREAVLSGLLFAVDHPDRDRLHREHATTRPRTVKRAIDAMRADPARPFTIVDLAAIAGVSRRALHEGFRRHVGVSPMAYLRTLRLERAHACLMRRGPDVTVAEVARRCGFTNPGRFAAAYRLRYGVPPSSTSRDRA